jgi:hypothetical protein
MRVDDRSLMDRFGLHFLGVLAAGVIVWQALGWWTKPPAVEFDNLRYIQLLTTAISSRKAEMVDKVASAVQKRHSQGAMSELELAHFEEILSTVRSGNWEQADREAYDFAAAQLSRRRSAPDPHAGHDHTH